MVEEGQETTLRVALSTTHVHSPRVHGAIAKQSLKIRGLGDALRAHTLAKYKKSVDTKSNQFGVARLTNFKNQLPCRRTGPLIF